MLNRLAHKSKFTFCFLGFICIILSVYETVHISKMTGNFYFNVKLLAAFCCGIASLAFGVFLTVNYYKHKEEIIAYYSPNRIYVQINKTTDGLKQISRKNRK